MKKERKILKKTFRKITPGPPLQLLSLQDVTANQSPDITGLAPSKYYGTEKMVVNPFYKHVSRITIKYGI